MAKIVLLRNLLLLLILLVTCNYMYITFNASPNKTTKKIDWTNYNFIEIEKLRVGPGEQGAGVSISDEKEINISKQLTREYSYNTVASDKISLDRSLPDTRPEDCLSFKYSPDLPAVSVIIVFHNEHLSFLLRTLHSVINRTPPKLLHEVILVDDCSTKDLTQLDWHIATHFQNKNVRVLRLNERNGLMRARMNGIRNATSDIVVVMDGHMEVNTNWLPPLIEPIVENFETVTEPVVDFIDWDTIKYSSVGSGNRGGFNWRLTYIMLGRKLEPYEKVSDNFNTPVILGAVAAFNKRYFWKLGGYDPGLKIWGGEQFDLSFKVWMCGGRIFQIPCSRVGHNYKGSGFHPYLSNRTYVLPNLKRVAEVWLDEYKDEFYSQTNSRNVDAGYLLPQIELRQRLGCKGFKWYINTLAPDLLERFPVDMSKFVAYGAIQSASQPKYCVDDLGAKNDQPIGLYSCHSQDLTKTLNPQFFLLTKNNTIRLRWDMKCWKVINEQKEENRTVVKLDSCSLQSDDQYFEYDLETQQIKTNSNYCLNGDYRNSSNPQLSIKTCDHASIEQKWKWHVNALKT